HNKREPRGRRDPSRRGERFEAPPSKTRVAATPWFGESAMPATNVCPGADELERLARGGLPTADAERITRHLDHCERYAAAVARLRGQAETPPHTEDLAQTDTDHPPSATSTDFLDPPRAAGELGWLAHYRVLKRLGQGGMGQVF